MASCTGGGPGTAGRVWLAISVAIAVGLAALPAALAAPARTTLVSKTSAGVPADADAGAPSISASGRYVAFESRAENLPGQVLNGQVYVHDRKTGKTRFVGKTSAGEPADGCSHPALSASGRFVAFACNASNLPGTAPFDVYVHDRKTGRTRLVSRTTAGEPGDDNSLFPSISASGRYVAFHSYADNLPGGASAYPGIYVHDRKTGRTRLASKTSDGTPADGGQSVGALISPTGRYVGFESNATNLGGDDSYTDVFVHDLKTGKTRLVSRNSQGQATTGEHSYGGWVSASGRFVGFESGATNLPGDDSVYDSFVRDLKTGKTKLVSKTSAGAPAAGGDSFNAFLSSSGRYVAFTSEATNLPGDDDWQDVYLHDRKTGKTKLMSKTTAGDPATGGASGRAVLARRARHIAFPSAATNLPGGGEFMGVFVRGPLR
jgi:Tol biopolymer transport system component